MPTATALSNTYHSISAFSFDGIDVRVVNLNGEIHFVGKDVCDRLGYMDPTNAMKQHCKGVVKRHPLLTAGGTQEVRVLNEADVLRLIVRSKLPEAERFERWVFEEVLPAIRKTGSYSTLQPPRTRRPSAKPIDRTFRQFFNIAKTIGLDDNQAMLKASGVAEKLCGLNVLQLMEIESLPAPRDEHTLTPRQIGQKLGNISSQRVNEALCRMKFQSYTHGGNGHRIYHLTAPGKAYGRLEDTSRKNTDGAVTVVRWYPSVLDEVAKHLNPSAPLLSYDRPSVTEGVI